MPLSDLAKFALTHPESRALLVPPSRLAGHPIRESRSAEEAYEKLMAQCQKHLAALKAELDRHKNEFKKNPRNWGYPGDLGKVESDLQEALDFLKE